MAANTNPIFALTPKNGYTTIPSSSANTNFDGTGTLATNIFSLFTAGSNGSIVTKIRVWHGNGTNTASVLRFYINNGSTNATASNNVLVYEYALAASTASNTVASVPAEITLNLPIQATYRLLVADTVSGVYHVSAEYGDY